MKKIQVSIWQTLLIISSLMLIGALCLLIDDWSSLFITAYSWNAALFSLFWIEEKPRPHPRQSRKKGNQTYASKVSLLAFLSLLLGLVGIAFCGPTAWAWPAFWIGIFGLCLAPLVPSERKSHDCPSDSYSHTHRSRGCSHGLQHDS